MPDASVVLKMLGPASLKKCLTSFPFEEISSMLSFGLIAILSNPEPLVIKS